MNKRNLIIAGVIIILALGTILAVWFGGFWYIVSKRLEKTDLTQVEVINENGEKEIQMRRKPELTDQDRAKMQAEIDKLHENPLDISNWKTYRNEKYGFEVRYPEGWVYTERFYKSADAGVEFLFGDKKCGQKYKDEGVESCNNLVEIAIYEDVIEKKQERKIFWNIEKYEYGGIIPSLDFSKELSDIKVKAFRNNSFGFVFDIYRFVKDNLGYELIIKYENPNYNPTIERTILESFQFTNKKE